MRILISSGRGGRGWRPGGRRFRERWPGRRRVCGEVRWRGKLRTSVGLSLLRKFLLSLAEGGVVSEQDVDCAAEADCETGAVEEAREAGHGEHCFEAGRWFDGDHSLASIGLGAASGGRRSSFGRCHISESRYGHPDLWRLGNVQVS